MQPSVSSDLSFSPFPGLWQIVEYNLSTSVCLGHGQCFVRLSIKNRHTHTTHTHIYIHIPESVTLNGINIQCWRETEKQRSNQSALRLPYTDPCHRLTSPTNETPVMHLNTKTAALQSGFNTDDGSEWTHCWWVLFSQMIIYCFLSVAPSVCWNRYYGKGYYSV